MNKVAIIILIVTLLLVGCGKVSSDYYSEYDSNFSNTIENEIPDKSIILCGVEELDEMRKMAQCTDDEALETYLHGVSGGGAQTRDDLNDFLNIIDTIPVLYLIDGNISMIYRSQNAKKGNDVVMISIKSDNGEWIRMEYRLSVQDTDESAQLQESSVMCTSDDNRAVVYSETTEPHPSGVGDLITWMMTIENIQTRVVYYTTDADKMVISDAISAAQIVRFCKE